MNLNRPTIHHALVRGEAQTVSWNPSTLSSPADCVLSPTNESVENICTLYGYTSTALSAGDTVGRQITTTNALNQTSLTVYDETNLPVIRVANWDVKPISLRVRLGLLN